MREHDGVTFREFASLSAAAYASRRIVGRFRREEGAPSGPGYRSYLWHEKASGRRVLCIRGTADPFDMLQDLRLLFGYEPRAWRKSREWVARQADQAGDLFVTGHSLGGAFASALGAEFQLPTVTFNAPGMLEALRRSGPVEPAWVRADQANILNFCVAEDWIWRLSGPGLGRVRTFRLTGSSTLNDVRGPVGAARALYRGRRLQRGWIPAIRSALSRHAMDVFRPLIARGEFDRDEAMTVPSEDLSSRLPISREAIPVVASIGSSL